MLFYRDGLTVLEICKKLGCTPPDLLPELLQPKLRMYAEITAEAQMRLDMFQIEHAKITNNLLEENSRLSKTKAKNPLDPSNILPGGSKLRLARNENWRESMTLGLKDLWNAPAAILKSTLPFAGITIGAALITLGVLVWMSIRQVAVVIAAPLGYISPKVQKKTDKPNAG